MRFFHRVLAAALALCLLAPAMTALAIGPAAEYFDALTDELKVLLDRDVPAPYEFVSGYRTQEWGEGLFLLVKSEGAYTLCIYGKAEGGWRLSGRRAGLSQCLGQAPRIVGAAGDSFYLQYEGQQAYLFYTFHMDGAGAWVLADYRYEDHTQGEQTIMFSVFTEPGSMDIAAWDGSVDIRQTVFGDMDLSLETVDIAGLPITLAQALGMFYGEHVAVVRNPIPQDRLHLRKAPDKGSASLGKFYNGVVVEILEFTSDSWVKVRVANLVEGYMAKEFLAFGEEMSRVSSINLPMKAHFIDEKETMPLFASPSAGGTPLHSLPYGTQVQVLGVFGEDWLFVQAGTSAGYAQSKYLWAGNG